MAHQSRQMSFSDQFSIHNPTSSFVNSSANFSARSLGLMDIAELISSTKDFEMFKKFLDSQNSLIDLECWMDIEAFS